MIQEIMKLTEGWTLTLAENHQIIKDGFDPKTLHELQASPYLTIAATVPGNFELDLHRAGLIDDPFYGDNPIKCQSLENRHLWYATTFDCPRGGDAYTYLAFDGIDTVADIYLNGNLLAHSENMLIGYEYAVPNLKETGNELVVHITPATIYTRQFPIPPYCEAMQYNYESLMLRKSPSMYGWDIMPRFVSGGIWKNVRLYRKSPNHIEDVFLRTKELRSDGSYAILKASIRFSTDLDLLHGVTVTMDGVCGESHFHTECRPFHTAFNHTFSIPSPVLWWPKNAGKPNLYEVTVRFRRGDVLLDEKKLTFGIRTVALKRTSCDDVEGNGDFHFEINGKPIFCMGTNWVPLDPFHSRDIEQLPSALALMDDVGCNIVRVWGGNVYESDEFYDFCDAHGIMVWQDFVMGCACYPEDDRFRAQLAEEATAVIVRLRNHPSLILWAGDNECDYSVGWNLGPSGDPNQNTLTRALLPYVCRVNDPSRPFLPSSPYVDEEAYRTGNPPSEDHLWGPRDYFKGDFYRNTVCHFASEIGYHACNSPDSLRKFIRPEHLWPNITDGVTDVDWLVHCSTMEPRMDTGFSYRIGLMTSQVKTLFGSVPADLNTYAKMSQISQAEAKKYFIERFRLTKWRRTGIIWWNIIDGWPQISDAVVDYYRTKKLAYHFIKRSQKPICLMFDEPQNGHLALYTVNDTPQDRSITYRVRDLDSDDLILCGKITAKADASVLTARIPVSDRERMLLIEWEGDGICGSNHYTTHTLSANYEHYASMLSKAGYDQFEGFSE